MDDYSKYGYAGRFLREYETKRTPETYAFHPQSLIIVPPSAVDFPDVSFYQGVIDWDYFATICKRVIIRAGQNTWIDPQFERNYTEAGRLGLSRGVYWFYDGRVKPSVQAGILADLLRGREPEMEVFADWEREYAGAYEGLPNVCEFMQLTESALPALRFDVGMYTGYYFFNDHTDPVTHTQQFAYLKTRPLWLPWYNEPAFVKVPEPWTTWVHWQYGTPVQDYGQQSQEIDKNKFNGDETAYSIRYGSTPTPEPPPGGSMTTYYLTAMASPTKQFANPDGTNDVGPNLPAGTKIISTLRNGVTYRNNSSGRYVKYNQVRLDSTVETPVPPPVPGPVTITKMEITLAKGSTVKTIYSDGTSKTETA